MKQKQKFFLWLAQKNTNKTEKSYPEFFLRYFSKFSLVDTHTKECLENDINITCKLCNAQFLLEEYKLIFLAGDPQSHIPITSLFELNGI